MGKAFHEEYRVCGLWDGARCMYRRIQGPRVGRAAKAARPVTPLLCEHVFTVQREPLEDVLTPDQTLELAIVDHR